MTDPELCPECSQPWSQGWHKGQPAQRGAGTFASCYQVVLPDPEPVRRRETGELAYGTLLTRLIEEEERRQRAEAKLERVQRENVRLRMELHEARQELSRRAGPPAT